MVLVERLVNRVFRLVSRNVKSLVVSISQLVSIFREVLEEELGELVLVALELELVNLVVERVDLKAALDSVAGVYQE